MLPLTSGMGDPVIATGTRPVRPASVEFDDKRILDSDGILQLEKLPESMVVVGASRSCRNATRQR